MKRVLRQDGTLWLNVGDLYAGSPAGNKGDRRIGNGGQIFENKPFSTVVGDLKPKDMVGLPWAVAFALRADGWWLRSAITWCKKSPMPESVRDRPTKATEQIFLLAKSSRYFFDAYAVRGLSKSLNLGDSINENLVVPQLSSPSSFAAESRDISSYYKFAPYFVLACFLTTKRIPVKQRYDYFSQIFNMFKSPMTDGSTILSGFHVPQLTAELIVNVLQNWEIIISKLDLQAESKFWIEFRSALAEAIVSIKTSLSIKESSEIVSKLIANIQILRQTIPLDALLEGLGRDSIGIDLSFDYLKNQARKRLSLTQLDHWIKGISKSGNGSKPEHKNKQIDRPGSSTQGMHTKRTEAGSVVLPMFEDL